MESTITISEVVAGKVKNVPSNPFPNVKVRPVIESQIPEKEEKKTINESKIAEPKEKPISEQVKKEIEPKKSEEQKNSSELDLNFFTRNWNDFLDQVEAEHPKFLTYLSEINLRSFDNGRLTIQINAEDEFNAKGIKKNQSDLEKIFKEYSGETIKLELEITNETIEQTGESEVRKPIKGTKGHPLFETIMETFEGEIIRS